MIMSSLTDLPGESIILDGYNQLIFRGICPTMTTRTINPNNYFLLECIDMKQSNDKRHAQEPAMLKEQRTEEAKARRKVCGDKGVKYSEGKEFAIREDGLSRTITTLADKECLIVEPVETAKVMQLGNIMDDDNRSFDNPQIGRVYSPSGVSPTLDTCGGGNRQPKVLELADTARVMQLGNMMDDCSRAFDNPERGRVYSSDGVSATIKSTNHKGPKLVLEPISCAMRGRNPDNPSDRRAGIPTEQRIELGAGVANTITTVLKDSMVAEPMAERVIASTQKNAYQGSVDSVSPSLTAAMGEGGGHIPMIAERTPGIRNVGNIYPSGGQGGKVVDPDGVAPAVCECHGEVTRIVEEPMVSAHPLSHAHENPKPRADISPTLRSSDHKALPVVYEPIKVRQATKQGYIECPAGGIFDANYPNSNLRRGRVQANGAISPALTSQGEPPCLYEGRVVDYKEMPDGSIRGYDPTTDDKRGISEEQYINSEGVAAPITAAHEPKIIEPQRFFYRIRKLQPIECFRLMDVTDQDFALIAQALDPRGKPLSKSRLYQLAGNSIVVSVLAHVFYALLSPKT